MPFDGITLHLVTNELKNKCLGARIEKIHQPTRDSFVLHLRSREGASKLLLRASPDSAGVYLTNERAENPSTPPMLCLLLRKRLTGGIITDIRQLSLDRAIYIDIRATDEIGDKHSFTLCAEIMAKNSNIILINEEGIILDSVRRVDATQSRVRQILPGFRYAMPPEQGKANILEMTGEEILSKISENGDMPLSKAILANFEGFSPLIAREVALLTSGSDIITGEMSAGMKAKFLSVMEKIKGMLAGNEQPLPVLLFKEENRPFDFAFMDISQYGGAAKAEPMPDFTTLFDTFYSEKSRFERLRQQGDNLIKTVSNLLLRSERKLQGRLTDLEECKDKDKLKLYAELILANQYSLKKGVDAYTVSNYYDDYAPLTIPADPALSPAANGQKYYKEYQKKKNAEKLLVSLIEESRAEVTYLTGVMDCISRADGQSEIAEIKQELQQEGYLKQMTRGKNNKNPRQKPLPPLRYVSSDGFEILVGKNNIQNESITFKAARKDDSWFHVQNMPGSHVVVLGEGEILPESTCREAAALAAYHSGARNSSQVPVDYTEVRHLKKPPQGKKGMVIYHTYNTMWVKPQEVRRAES